MWGLAMAGADICGFEDWDAYTSKALGPLQTRLSDKDYQELCIRYAEAADRSSCDGSCV
jgi:alpha-glucosidase (family GH31 glycosyl hydrolase)